MLDCVLMVCASIDCRTRLVWDCWIECVCVGRLCEKYVGECVVWTTEVGDIGSWDSVSYREDRLAFV